jgi:hypothetical protein
LSNKILEIFGMNEWDNVGKKDGNILLSEKGEVFSVGKKLTANPIEYDQSACNCRWKFDLLRKAQAKICLERGLKHSLNFNNFLCGLYC